MNDLEKVIAAMDRVGETNGLVDPKAYHDDQPKYEVSWRDKRLARITRLRMVSDPGFPMWDITYCDGVDHEGNKVRVHLPFSQLPKKSWKRDIVAAAQRDGVFAKGLGIFDAISTLC